ncbi:MAG: lysophospholipid acyltransferase family protein [Christensenellales bacterium]
MEDNKDVLTTTDDAKATKPAQKPKKQPQDWLIFRIIGKVGRFLAKLFWPTFIYGKRNIVKGRKCIYICNHLDAFDPFVIVGRVLKEESNVVMKSSLADSAFLRYSLYNIAGGIPIKRNENDVTAVKKILGVLNHKNQPVLIFPEGTRNPHDIKEMIPFKDGTAVFALKTKCEIVPMLYYKKIGPFRINRLFIGKPFDLSEFYSQSVADAKSSATEFIYQKMLALRAEMDFFVEKCHCDKKKFLAEYGEGQFV